MRHRVPGNRLIMALLSLMLVLPAAARETEVDGTPIDRAVYRGYEANWRKYARFACEIDGGYAFFPNYDRRHESSRGLTVSQVMDQMTERWEERKGNLVVKKSKAPPREDAEAYARALPSLDVGSYGWVASAEVVKVIDKNTMIVREVWLVNNTRLRKSYEEDQEQLERRTGQVNHDELRFDYKARIKLKEQQEDDDEGFTETFRLIGYDTRGLRVGDRWEGPNNEGFQVGVVRWETPEPEEENSRRRGREEPRLVLSKVEDAMRTTLDEEGFKKLLDERGMTVVAFVDLVRDMRERDRENAEERIINALLPPEREEEE